MRATALSFLAVGWVLSTHDVRAWQAPGSGPEALPPLQPPAAEPPIGTEGPPALPPPAVSPPTPAPAPPPASPAPTPRASPPSPSSAPPTSGSPLPPPSEPTTPKLLTVSAGLGISGSTRSNLGQGNGFYASGEWVDVLSPWITPRAYVGLLLTFADQNSCGGATPCDVSARIGFLGGKLRVTIPIPYVAPFFELGLGLSMGAFSTMTPDAQKDGPWFTYHVPVSIGLSLGKDRTVDLGFSYLFHPALAQIDGGVVASLSFPLR